MALCLVICCTLGATIVSSEWVEATQDLKDTLSNLLFEMDNLKCFEDEAKSEMSEMIDSMRKNISAFVTKYNVKRIASDLDESPISGTENMNSTDFNIIKNKLGLIDYILKIMKGKLVNAEKAMNDVKIKVTEFESIVIPAVEKIRNQTDHIEVGIEHIRENLTTTLESHHNKVATDITKSIENHSENLETKINIMVNTVSNVTTDITDVCNDTFINGFDIIDQKINSLKVNIDNVSSNVISIGSSLGIEKTDINLMKNDISHINKGFSSVETSFKDFRKSYETDRNTMAMITATLNTIYKDMGIMQIKANLCCGDISKQSSKFSALESKLLDMGKYIKFVGSKIDSIEKTVVSSKGKTDAILNQVGTLEGKMNLFTYIINFIQSNVSNIQEDINYVKEDIKSTENAINLMEKRILHIESLVETNVDKTTNIQTNVAAFKYYVETIQTDINSISKKMSSIENGVNIGISKNQQILNTEVTDSPKLTDPPNPKTDVPSGGGKCDYSTFDSLHTMNLPKNKNCWYHNGGVSDDDIQTILQTHNELRAKVANGLETQGSPGPQPDATNMKELRWNPQLAEVAQAWAEQCPRGHDSFRNICDPDYIVGQNMYWMWSSDPKSDWNHVIGRWYGEVKDMPASLVDSVKQRPSRKVIRHYKQVVWANTYEVGCGIISYSSNRRYITYPHAKIYVCNYGPAGNARTTPVYERGAAASNCPHGASSDYPGLCAVTTS